MTTVRGARSSSVYTDFEELDFAKDALIRVSIIAADIGAQQKSCVAGCLAAKLLIARRALETADATELPRIQRRLPKLLDDLERVCAIRCTLGLDCGYTANTDVVSRSGPENPNRTGRSSDLYYEKTLSDRYRRSRHGYKMGYWRSQTDRTSSGCNTSRC
jgi:hypothetical protein